MSLCVYSLLSYLTNHIKVIILFHNIFICILFLILCVSSFILSSSTSPTLKNLFMRYHLTQAYNGYFLFDYVYMLLYDFLDQLHNPYYKLFAPYILCEIKPATCHQCSILFFYAMVNE